MPKAQLASNRMNTGGSPGGLNPVTLSGNSVAALATPGIDPNAGSTSFTKVQTPQFKRDTTLDTALKAGDVLVQAASQYAERRDNILAREAVLEYNEFLREGFYGKTDTKGKKVPGYSQTVGIDAGDNFQGYQSGIEAGLKDRLSSLPSRVKAKALPGMYQAREQYLSAASTHSAKHMQVAEKQAQYVSQQDTFKDIEVNGVAGASNGTWAAHLAMFPTPQERDAELARLSKYAVEKKYNRVLEDTHDPRQAIIAAKQDFENIRTSLPEAVELELNQNILKIEDVARTQYNANKGEIRERYFDQESRRFPQKAAQSLQDENYLLLYTEKDRLDGVYSSGIGQEKVYKAWLEGVKDAAIARVMSPELKTSSAREAVLLRDTSGMLDPRLLGNYPVSVQEDMRDFYQHTLPKKLEEHQKDVDGRALHLSVEQQLSGAPPEKVLSSIDPETSRAMVKEITDNVQGKALEEEKIQALRAARGDSPQDVKASFIHELNVTGPLSRESLEELDRETVAGRISHSDRKEVLLRNKRTVFGGKIKEYSQDPVFKTTVELIHAVAKNGGFNHQKKPMSLKKTAVSVWEVNNALTDKAAQDALVRDYEEFHKENPEGGFDGTKWIRDYRMTILPDSSYLDLAGAFNAKSKQSPDSSLWIAP